jgi:hypothetical protein
MFAQLPLLSLAAFAPLVAAHGSLHAAWIDGKYYPAPLPQEDASQYTIRSINDINPVKGTNNPDLNCGHGAQRAGLVADAAPGSKLEFAWRNGELGTWVHNTGPVLTYLAPCGNGGCAKFDSANAQFFKISELGKHADGNGWFMADLTTGPNATTSVTLPANLPAGEYLVRHELIAMQLGMSPGGAEFYPACMQIRLSAPSRTAAAIPSGKEVVTFPGGYSDNDPGILDPNIYNPGSAYTFPGPAIAALASSGNTGSTSGSDAPTGTIVASSSSTTPGSSAPTPTATGGGCGGSRQKKRVIKRIVQQGPLIKRHANKAVHKRQEPPSQKRAPAPTAVAAAKERTFAVRSRVMRGI